MDTPASRNKEYTYKSPDQVRKDMARLKQKISHGLEKIYDLCLQEKSKLKKELLDLPLSFTAANLQDYDFSQYFPSKLAFGLQVFLINAKANNQPPILYILQKKLAWLSTALNLSPEEAQLRWSELLTQYKKQNKKSNKLNAPRELHQELVQFMLSRLSQHEGIQTIVTRFHELWQENASILIFNEENATFSFEEVFLQNNKSHSEELKYIHILYEGIIHNPTKLHINHFTLIHDSLVPNLTATKTHNAMSLRQEIDVIIATCNRIDTVVQALLALRMHGKDQHAKHEKIDIDWTYQLLMSNILNDDSKFKYYDHLVNAINLMNGMALSQGNLNLHMMHAGLNTWSEWNFGQLYPWQMQSAHAFYLYLNKQCKKHLAMLHVPLPKEEPSYVKIFNQLILYYEHVDPVHGLCLQYEESLHRANHDYDKKVLRKEYEAKFSELEKILATKLQYESEQKNIARSFNESRIRYNRCSKSFHDNELRKTTIKDQSSLHSFNRAQDELKRTIEDERAIIMELIKNAVYYAGKLDVINKKLITLCQEYWELNQTKIQGLVKELVTDPTLTSLLASLDNAETAKKEHAISHVRAVSIIILRSYFDQLFFANRYCEPKNALLLNNYLSYLLHLLDGMTSISNAKEAERIYIYRLFMSALINKEISSDHVFKPLHHDLEEFKACSEKIAKEFLTNSALFSYIEKHFGCPPEINEEEFKYLQFVGNLQLLTGLGWD